MTTIMMIRMATPAPAPAAIGAMEPPLLLSPAVGATVVGDGYVNLKPLEKEPAPALVAALTCI